MRDFEDFPGMLKLANSEEEVFEKIFHAYSSQVYSFSLRLTRSASMAEEIVQDVFLKVWLNRATLTTITNLPGYLYTLTRNHALNMLKRMAIEEKAKQAVFEQSLGRHNETEDTVIYRDYQQKLKNAINHLPPQQKLVYSLCHQEGLRYEEVAQRLNISRLTVKTHMQQALRTIKSQFAQLVRVVSLLIPLTL